MFTLLHSGIVYPSERDPTKLFEALAAVRSARPDIFRRLVVRFRAPVHRDLLEVLSARHCMERTIEVVPPLPYREAVEEMTAADGLLVMQASNCNAQVPAKIYEYFRAGRPVLVLADPLGDTAAVARKSGLTAIAALEDGEAIARLLVQYIEQPSSGTLPTEVAVAEASRERRTKELAKLLDRSVDDRARP
jgi:hypothetical protein